MGVMTVGPLSEQQCRAANATGLVLSPDKVPQPQNTGLLSIGIRTLEQSNPMLLQRRTAIRHELERLLLSVGQDARSLNADPHTSAPGDEGSLLWLDPVNIIELP
jgi:hypothetical protein